MVAACGVILAVGGGVLAAPAGAAPEVSPDYPLGGPGTPHERQQSEPEKRIEKAPEKAEKLGAGTVGELLDLGTNVIKCGLNIATPTVKCKL